MDLSPEEEVEVMTHVIKLLTPPNVSDKNPIKNAFATAGINTIMDLFVFPENNILLFQIKVNRCLEELNTGYKQIIIQFKRWLFFLVQENGGDMLTKDEILEKTRQEFNCWRMSAYMTKATTSPPPTTSMSGVFSSSSPATAKTDVDLFKRSI